MSGPDRTVAPGQVWRHHRGTHYFVVAVAQHTETQEQLVVYRLTNNSDQFWARPLEMFLSSTNPLNLLRPSVDGGELRFVRVR